MTRKNISRLLVVILIAVMAASCSKPASVATEVTPTSLGDLPFPLATQPDIMNEILFGTQTAEAMAHEMPAAESTEEPTVIIDLSENAETETTPMAEGDSTMLEPTVEGDTTTSGTITTTDERPETYTVHKGEFPYCLARRFNVSAGDLLSVNGIAANTQVSEGTVLTIPQSGEWSSGERALKSHPVSYTVGVGETIYTIACAFGDVNPKDIIAANDLEDPYTLTSGIELHIP
ncbi:MAG: LysM peptidoglycan-binding domain-containing protein [Anaerolineaceae bacterium]|nr:LysM peptidoglycan-binding domain-containing protein [Anaerolineaceae bacterium]